MPLHDWTQDEGWDSVHILWLTHLFHWIKPRLPNEFRAYVGSIPSLAVSGLTERPDVAVRHWLPEPPAESPSSAEQISATALREEPDIETATLTLEPHKSLYVTHRGRLVAAVELVSPRNKARMSARQHYLARYLGYLIEG